MGINKIGKVDVKNLIIRGSFLLVFLCLSLFSYSQTPKEFSAEQSAYLKELSDWMIAEDKQRGKRLMEESFIPFINAGGLSGEQLSHVYEISNLMLKKRMRAYPEFESFCNLLMSFEKANLNIDQWNVWKDIMIELGRGKKKSTFVSFFEASTLLILEKVLYKSSTVTWKSSGYDFIFISDSLPIVQFKETNLTCVSKGDSSVIYETEGLLFPTRKILIGKGGRITWERVGLPKDEVFAELQDYKLRMKSSAFSMDSVLFHNQFFKYPLMGSLTEKILAGKDSATASHPYFESYDKRLLIRNIVENVNYDGGFVMKGNKLEGFGTREEPAKLIFYRDDRPFAICKSNTFLIKPDKISSASTKTAIYLRSDSIYHPGVNLKFDRESRVLTLIRTEEGVSKSPFYNSYHGIDMYVETMYWNIDDPLIRMGNLMGSTQTKAAFESENYYKKKRFDAMLGIDNVHPLVRLKNFAKRIGTKEFWAEDYARHIRLPQDQVIKQFIILNNQGFLAYDAETEWVKIKDKLYHYLDNSAGKRDYDVLLFNSNQDKGQNAQLNLMNNDLLMKGVSRIVLSDSQNVKIFPSSKEVTLRKNRDFVFDGVIVAGNVEFYGEDHEFLYDEFKIKMIQVDSVQLRVKPFENDNTARRRILVKNVIEGIEGELAIDHPRNKNGLKSDQAPEFPIVTSNKDSYVYYDRKDLQGGVYDRENFFFKVDPFILDSLDNFDPTNLNLDGTLVSGGIFPDINNTLTVQPDYSLGFTTNTGSSGFAAYGGKSKFTNDVSLNYSGLQGSGDLDYLTSHAESEQFTFLPEQVLGRTSTFTNSGQKGTFEVPDVSIAESDLDYRPNEEIMSLTSLETDFDFFNGQTFFEGRIDLTPDGMSGDGTMKVIESELESDHLEFEFHALTADTAEFRLISPGSDGMAFKTENVNARIDLDDRLGTFKSNGEASFVEFPENQYICYMDVFKWFIDKNDIAMEYDGGVSGDFVIDTELDLTTSNFYSTRKDQDSLNFMAPKALYNLGDKVIRCSDVDYIRIADAKISPDSGLMKIKTRARIDPLQNASISANAVTQYHRIEEATVKIYTSKNYEGEGLYNYVDENGGAQVIRFSEIVVDSSLQSVAEGRIIVGDDFTLSPAFQFYGEVYMQANKQHLTFDGNTRIFHECEGLDRNWMSFTSEIDPKEIFIPISKTFEEGSEFAVGAGLMQGQEPIELYTTFLSELRDERDTEVLPADGFLFFNKKEQAYQIASKEKLRQRSYPGNFISLDIKSCSVSGDGKFDFGANLGMVDINPIGDFRHDIAANEYTFETALSLDFFFSDEALKRMAEKVISFPDFKPLVIQNTKYETAIKDILGLEKSDKVISELSLTGNLKKIPQELTSSLFFSNVTFKWDDETESFISDGKLGLVNIGKKQVFLQVNGKIQLIRRRGGDVLNIYLEMDDANWYYFTYSKGLMLAIASDKEFNNIITEVKDDKRKAEKVKGKDPYSYMLGSRSKRNRFLDDMEEL